MPSSNLLHKLYRYRKKEDYITCCLVTIVEYLLNSGNDNHESCVVNFINTINVCNFKYYKTELSGLKIKQNETQQLKNGEKILPDIIIDNGTKFMIIEVKDWAKPSDNQKKYKQWLKERNKNRKGVMPILICRDDNEKEFNKYFKIITWEEIVEIYDRIFNDHLKDSKDGIVEYYVKPFKEFLAREIPMKRLDGDFEKSLKQTATFFKMLKDVSEDSRALHKRKGLKFVKCKMFTDEYSFMGCEYEDEDGKFYIGIYPDEPLVLRLWFDDNYKASKFNKANFTKENNGWYWAKEPIPDNFLTKKYDDQKLQLTEIIEDFYKKLKK